MNDVGSALNASAGALVRKPYDRRFVMMHMDVLQTPEPLLTAPRRTSVQEIGR
jgi:hypothetical protein